MFHNKLLQNGGKRKDADLTIEKLVSGRDSRMPFGKRRVLCLFYDYFMLLKLSPEKYSAFFTF